MSRETIKQVGKIDVWKEEYRMYPPNFGVSMDGDIYHTGFSLVCNDEQAAKQLALSLVENVSYLEM